MDQPKQIEHPNLNAGVAEGNNYAMKFKTPEERKAMCANYIGHVKQGFPDEFFPICDMQTLRRYIKDFPEDFDTELMENAKRERGLYWIKMGINGTVGIPANYKVKNKDGTSEDRESKGKFNDRSWKFIMQNMFGWKEKTDITTDDDKINLPVIYIPKEDPNK